jgi:hypothetical protein
MPIQATTLRPGFLVSLKTSVSGNVSYEELAKDVRIDNDGAEITVRESERTIRDREEHDRAIKTRSRCRSLVTGVCAKTPGFGLLCPKDREERLQAAIEASRRTATDFNLTSSYSKIEVNVICGEINPSDLDAVRAINSEVRDLITVMTSGLTKSDVDTVRKAAAQARELSLMLDDEGKAKVEETIATARKAATEVRKAAKEGKPVDVQAAIAELATARHAFLDVDQPAAAVAAPEAESRAGLDLDVENGPVSFGAAPAQFGFDL